MTSTASSSPVAPVGNERPVTREEVNKWDIERVAAWARAYVKEPHVATLTGQEVDGRALLTLTEEKLTRHPYNLPGGPAAILGSEIQKWLPPSTGWKRDLLRECVEPNPGPEMSVVFDTIANERFPSNPKAIRDDLAKIEDAIKHEKKSPGKYGYTDTHVKDFFCSKDRKDIVAIIGDEDDADIIIAEVKSHLGITTGGGGALGILGSLGWKRELLRECIEPNPGPSDLERILDAVVDSFDKDKQASEAIGKIQQAIFAANTSVPQFALGATHIKQYFENMEAANKLVGDVVANAIVGRVRETVTRILIQQAPPSNQTTGVGSALGNLATGVGSALGSLASTAPYVDSSPGELISHLRTQFPQYKNVTVAPDAVLVDRPSNLFGRDNELKQLAELEKYNISSYKDSVQTQRMYVCPLVHGALGIGKTRLIADFNLSTAQRLLEYEIDCTTASIYMDFTRGDSIQSEETSVLNVLGLRLASHFFFGKAASWLVGQVGLQGTQVFPFTKVIELISSEFCTNKPLVLTMQLDEFGVLSPAYLDAILRIIATQMSGNHQSKVWLLPYLTGTTVEVGLRSISNSKLTAKGILLGPLLPRASLAIVHAAIDKTAGASSSAAILRLKGTMELRVAVDSLGNNPRNLQFFGRNLECGNLGIDNIAFLSLVLWNVVLNIRDNYDTSRWRGVLGDSQTALTRLCVWALTGREVNLNDRLNGITIEDVRSNGIIQLVPVERKETFTIALPLVTLRALNIPTLLVPDNTLNPFSIVSTRQFEDTMGAVQVLLNNMLAALGATATYQDLYPHAIGREETLKRVVSITSMEEFWADGNSDKHESAHNFPLTAIPIRGGMTIDAAEGSKYIHNVDMAPSFDALVIRHAQLAVEQHKSSGEISRGKLPSTNSKLKLGEDPKVVAERNAKKMEEAKATKATKVTKPTKATKVTKATKATKATKTTGSTEVIEATTAKATKYPKTIWGEYSKATNQDHKAFYRCPDLNTHWVFVLISNKPLAEWEKIQQNPDELPPNTLVICYENFKQYCSILCTRAIYVTKDDAEMEGLEYEDEDNEENDDDDVLMED